MSQTLALLQAAADRVNNTRAEVILVKSIAQKTDWRYGNAEIRLLITRNLRLSPERRVRKKR